MIQEPHIRVRSVDAVYDTAAGNRLVALSGVDLTVQRGEFVSIIGPSGCGKSTLLRLIGGLQFPSQGEVLVDGRSPREAQRRKQIGFVFQDPSLLPWRNVIDNVRLPVEVNKQQATSDRQQGRIQPGLLLETVGLEAFRDYYPHQLSGGMQQRVALARSLVTSPTLLLMDEPFGALDEITRSAMRYELLRIWRDEAASRGCTVVFVTHSIAEAVVLSDRVIVLTPRPGRIAGILSIHLPRPRDEEVELSPAFLDYTRSLRDLLRERSSIA
jgi:NitT/TauT family transport system ATP-binding protein